MVYRGVAWYVVAKRCVAWHGLMWVALRVGVWVCDDTDTCVCDIVAGGASGGPAARLTPGCPGSLITRSYCIMFSYSIRSTWPLIGFESRRFVLRYGSLMMLLLLALKSDSGLDVSRLLPLPPLFILDAFTLL